MLGAGSAKLVSLQAAFFLKLASTCLRLLTRMPRIFVLPLASASILYKWAVIALCQ